MKTLSKLFLLIFLFSIFIQPLFEFANVIKEKIVIGAALGQALRAAKEDSFDLSQRRDRNAVADMQKFKQTFASVFSTSLGIETPTHFSDTLSFSSNNPRYNSMSVTVTKTEQANSTDQTTTQIDVSLQTNYKFQTQYLQKAQQALGLQYLMKAERTILLEVRN